MTTNQPNWLELIRAERERGVSIQAIADKISVKRSALSQVLNGCGPYGTGKAKTSNIEERVLKTLGSFACPFLSESGGTVEITGLQCREFAGRETPTNNPREMRHWRACQGCEKNQAAATQPQSEVFL